MWKIHKTKYSQYEVFYSGKIAVGTVEYDGLRNRDDPRRYKWRNSLSGEMGNVETTIEAQQILEASFAAWLEKASLKREAA
jgi:hypothetical protein